MTEEDKNKLKRNLAAYELIFNTPEGQLVLDDLALQCYEGAVTFVDNNPYGSAFNEGKRFVLIHIRRMIATRLKG